MDHRSHIIVVEEDVEQRQRLIDYLERQNFRVSTAEDGAVIRRLVERDTPALVLLDIGLMGEDGVALIRWLREKSRIGIILVSAAIDTVDHAVGLEIGADDYMGKPYNPRELLAQTRSVLRRVTGAGGAPGCG